MKYIFIAVAFAVGMFALSASPVAAQCSTTVQGNSSDDGVIILGPCVNSNTNIYSVTQNGRGRMRNRTRINGGNNAMIAGQDQVGGQINVQGSSLVQTFSQTVNYLSINF